METTKPRPLIPAFCSRKTNGSLYFSVTYLAYFAGLLLTMAVMHIFKAAQVPPSVPSPLSLPQSPA